jgi:hypothetical protein
MGLVKVLHKVVVVFKGTKYVNLYVQPLVRGFQNFKIGSGRLLADYKSLSGYPITNITKLCGVACALVEKRRQRPSLTSQIKTPFKVAVATVKNEQEKGCVVYHSKMPTIHYSISVKKNDEILKLN